MQQGLFHLMSCSLSMGQSCPIPWLTCSCTRPVVFSSLFYSVLSWADQSVPQSQPIHLLLPIFTPCLSFALHPTSAITVSIHSVGLASIHWQAFCTLFHYCLIGPQGCRLWLIPQRLLQCILQLEPCLLTLSIYCTGQPRLLVCQLVRVSYHQQGLNYWMGSFLRMDIARRRTLVWCD